MELGRNTFNGSLQHIGAAHRGQRGLVKNRQSPPTAGSQGEKEKRPAQRADLPHSGMAINAIASGLLLFASGNHMCTL
ncbi:hypothetical protein LEMLEM_LOCUS8250 [Lemmus lemmus]